MLHKFFKSQRWNWSIALIPTVFVMSGGIITLTYWQHLPAPLPGAYLQPRIAPKPASSPQLSTQSGRLDQAGNAQSTSIPPTLQQPIQPVGDRNYPPLTLSYNVTSLPPFQPSPSLQRVLDQVVTKISAKGLPIKSLSISLIDLKHRSCCEYAAYQDQQPRFPASVSKLFWLVAYYAQMEAGILTKHPLPDQELYKMAHKSDNESASRVIDLTSGAASGSEMNEEALGIWAAKRKWFNRYFEAAGYHSVNVSQKNFPIPFLQLQRPTGRELQMRGDANAPIRNAITTYDTARLLYEITTEKAVSASASRKMKELLRQDLASGDWRHEEYNSIEGFLGESLPPETEFVSKVGWTGTSRQEAALITSSDGNAKYILVIFGDDKGYGDDWKIFPSISRVVFDEMRLR